VSPAAAAAAAARQQAYDALPPGGAFIAVEVLIDDARRANLWGLMMSLDMLMEFEGENSFDYSFQVRACVLCMI
jgi:hypothetical protein